MDVGTDCYKRQNFEESGEDWAKDLIKIFKWSSSMGLKIIVVLVIMIMRKSHHM